MADSPLQWFCVRTGPRKETAVGKALSGLGVAVYLPIEATMRKCRGVRRRLDRALIPGHLFFGADAASNVFAAVRETDGVRRILSSEREGAPREVPWRAIAIVQAAEGELLDQFQRRYARAEEADRNGDDTDRFIERLKEAPREQRIEIIYQLMGRGRKARLRLAELQQFL